MTIIVATRDRIVADSRLVGGDNCYNTVCKIFRRRRDRALFATAGDSRLTDAFERAHRAGKIPEALEAREDEDFEGVILSKDRLELVDKNFASFDVGEHYVILGSSWMVAKSWILNNATPEDAVRRVIEVDAHCGFPIVVAPLHGPVSILEA